MSESSFRLARKELDTRHGTALLEQQTRRERIIGSMPGAASVIRRLDGTGNRIAQAMFSGADPKAAILKLMEETTQLRAQLTAQLTSGGYPPDYLELHVACTLCNDTGYIGGRKCRCLKELAAKYSAMEFNENANVTPESFASFSLDYYPDVPAAGATRSPRQIMGDIFNFCRVYAERFERHAPSVLMMGDTGLGKTHLSLAIAGEVMKKGFSVLYASTPDLFRRLQNEYYGKGDPGVDTMELLQRTNLIILDDLGAEMESQFNATTLYNIVNSRLNGERPTIISTNLPPRELERRYSSRVASRLMTMYKCLKFFGKDIRQLKLKDGISLK